jgi:hypothetical protein
MAQICQALYEALEKFEELLEKEEREGTGGP